MSLTSLALRFAAPPPKIEDYERYLFLGPHPDDIEIGAGATAARLAAAGKQVTCHRRQGYLFPYLPGRPLRSGPRPRGHHARGAHPHPAG